MKKGFLFCIILQLFISSMQAQNDYVIEEPKNTSNTGYEKLENPDFTNYLLTSSAFTLKERDMRISNTDIFFTKGSYGLTDNTTASLSVSLLGTFIASIKQQIHVNEDVKLGVSAAIGQAANLPTDSIVFYTGGQAMITLGDLQNNITLGVGLYYAKSSFDVINEEREFLLSNIYVATQKQIGRRVYVVAEGIYFNNYNILSGSLGTKITIKESMTIGVGVMPLMWFDPNINTSNIESTALPLISFRMLLDRS